MSLEVSMKENDFCIDCLRYNGGCDFSLKPINNKGEQPHPKG